MMAKTRNLTPWLMVCFGMLFYSFNYFLRVSPSAMQLQLTEAFHIDATKFALLAACYYWAYTPMQLPAGMIYDKFGVRFVLSAACLMAVAGLAVFISANNLYFAIVGRILVGLGCAFAYIGTLKLASLWLPPSRFGTIAGVATAVGMISGAMAEKYLSHVVALIGYQAALKSCLVTGVLLSMLLITFVRNAPKAVENNPDMQNPINFSQLLKSLKLIFSNKQMWLIGTIGCLLYLPSSVFLDTWGIPYLKAVYNLTADQAATTTGFTFYGWIISGPIIGMISDKIKRRKIPLMFTGFFAAILLCCVFYIPNFATLATLNMFFFLIGFCCGAHSLCFALGKENNPIQMSGTSVAATNMLIMMGGLIFQPVVGKLLDLHTSGTLGVDGLPIYTASDYTFALSIIPFGVSLGIVLCAFLKETHCESQATMEQEAMFDNVGIAPVGKLAVEPAK